MKTATMDYLGILLILVQLFSYHQATDSNFITQILRQAKHNKIPINGVFETIKLNPGGGLSAGGIPKVKTTTEEPNVRDDLMDVVEPAASNPVCADIVFANDASCSLGKKVRADHVNLIVDIASRLTISDDLGARLGAFSFGQYVDVQTKVDFKSGVDRPTVLSELGNIRTNNMTCRTIPYRAMSMANGYFNGADDRDDEVFKDVLIFIGDGWTSPIRTRKLSLKLAEELKRDNVDILWIKTQAKKTKDLKNEIKYGGSAFEVEILPIVGDVDKTFNYKQEDSERVVNDVSEYLFKNYKCP